MLIDRHCCGKEGSWLPRKEFKSEPDSKVKAVYWVEARSTGRVEVASGGQPVMTRLRAVVFTVRLFNMGIRERHIFIGSQKGWALLETGDTPLFCPSVPPRGVMALVGVSAWRCVTMTDVAGGYLKVNLLAILVLLVFWSHFDLGVLCL